MGSTHSAPEQNGAPCCQRCFFLYDISKHFGKANGSSDLMGSPLPETPQVERRKRAEVQQHMKTSNESQYLEKELLIPPRINNNNQNNNGQQQLHAPPNIIHDGPDCEKLLHEKYQLMEVLGVGSTSTVHRCVSKKDDVHFACKIIDCQLIEERFAGMMGQFQTEIEALRQLHHPGIIRLYDVYMTDQKIYIVMELMEGGELFDYVVQKGTLTELEAAKIVRKVTSAIAYMHGQNFIHRDLKPENLLLKKTPKGPYDEIDVKIIDFGLSKVTLAGLFDATAMWLVFLNVY
jgi:serine/threonine protein kinase